MYYNFAHLSQYPAHTQVKCQHLPSCEKQIFALHISVHISSVQVRNCSSNNSIFQPGLEEEEDMLKREQEQGQTEHACS